MLSNKLLSKGAVRTRKFCRGSDKDTLWDRGSLLWAEREEDLCLAEEDKDDTRVNLTRATEHVDNGRGEGDWERGLRYPLMRSPPLPLFARARIKINLNRQKIPCSGNGP